MSKKQKETWQNLIMYITACHAQEEDAQTREEGQSINDEMYNWLTTNYVVRRKPQGNSALHNAIQSAKKNKTT